MPAQQGLHHLLVRAGLQALAHGGERHGQEDEGQGRHQAARQADGAKAREELQYLLPRGEARPDDDADEGAGNPAHFLECTHACLLGLLCVAGAEKAKRQASQAAKRSGLSRRASTPWASSSAGSGSRISSAAAAAEAPAAVCMP